MTLVEWKDIAAISQSIATIAALAIGGLWTYAFFVRQRLRYPHAEVKHNVAVEPANELHFVRADVVLRNVGSTLIRVESIDVWIQQVLPLPKQISDAGIIDRSRFSASQTDFDWPMLDRRTANWSTSEAEIEPGESQIFNFDFVVPSGADRIQVYSYIKNSKKRRREIGWRTTTTHETLKKGEAE